MVSSSPEVTHHSPVSSKSILVIRVPCLLENRFEGLNAPSNCPVIGKALMSIAKSRNVCVSKFGNSGVSFVHQLDLRLCCLALQPTRFDHRALIRAVPAPVTVYISQASFMALRVDVMRPIILISETNLFKAQPWISSPQSPWWLLPLYYHLHYLK